MLAPYQGFGNSSFQLDQVVKSGTHSPKPELVSIKDIIIFKDIKGTGINEFFIFSFHVSSLDSSYNKLHVTLSS